MPTIQRTILPLTSVAAAAVLALGVLASPAGAADTADTKTKVDIDRLGYEFTLRAGAIEPYADIPRHLPTDFGYTMVNLVRDIGEGASRCESNGAGYFLGQEVEEGVIKGGAAPISEGQTAEDGSPYKNPTFKRVVRPEIGAEAGNSAIDQEPAFPANGNGPKWTAECTNNEFGGTATGDMLNAGGLRIGGSTITALLDESTGVMTATARAYMSGMDGQYESGTSLMRVVVAPGGTPVVTWRMAFFTADSYGSAWDNQGLALGGTNIPANEFVTQFNDQVAANAPAMAAIGPAGAAALAPEFYPNQDNRRPTTSTSAGHGNVGLTQRTGTIGQNFGLRVGSVTFTGSSVYDG